MENAEIKNDYLKAFNCSNCGASLKNQPGTETLVCEYCNVKNTIPLEPTIIKENNYDAYLNKLESDNLVVEKTVQCKGCGATSTININSDLLDCPYCSAPLTDGNINEGKTIKPSYLLPFVIDKQKAASLAADWAKDSWFTKDVQSSSINTTPIYLPFWTFDAQTNTAYTLQKTEKINDTVFSQSRTANLSLFFDDIMIRASENISNDLLNEMGPWDTKKLVNTDNSYLSDYVVEKYNIDIKKGFELAKTNIIALIKNKIYDDATRVDRNINIAALETHYADIHFKLIILPIYINTYEYKGQKYQMYLNGHNGKATGKRPKNPIRVVLWKIVKYTLIFILIVFLLPFVVLLISMFF